MHWRRRPLIFKIRHFNMMLLWFVISFGWWWRLHYHGPWLLIFMSVHFVWITGRFWSILIAVLFYWALGQFFLGAWVVCGTIIIIAIQINMHIVALMPDVIKLTIIALCWFVVAAAQLLRYWLIEWLVMMEFIRFFMIRWRLEVRVDIVWLRGGAKPCLIGWCAALIIDLNILFEP